MPILVNGYSTRGERETPGFSGKKPPQSKRIFFSEQYFQHAGRDFFLPHMFFEGKRPGISIIPGGGPPPEKHRHASHGMYSSVPARKERSKMTTARGIFFRTPSPGRNHPHGQAAPVGRSGEKCPEAQLSLDSTMLILGTIRLKMMKAAR